MKNTTLKTLFTCFLCLTFLISIGFGTVTAYGESTSISTDEGSLTASMDGEYLYLSYEGPWDYNIQETISISVNGSPVSGANSAIVLNAGNAVDSQSIPVRNAWWGEISGASCTVTNLGYANGRYETATWQLQVPIATYGTDISDIGLTWKDQSVTVIPNSSDEDSTEDASTEQTEDTTEATSTEETTSTTETTTESTTESSSTTEDELIHVTSDIQIDGYYDDWTSYPVTEITYTSNNTKSIHKGQIYTDGEMVYVHFAMNDLYTAQMQVQQMTITINGEAHTIGVYPVHSDGSIDWDYYNNEMRSLPEGIHQNFGVIVDYTKYCESQAAMTIYDPSHQPDTKGDEIEFAFSLADFGRITGMNTDTVNSITIVNPNIGSQGVSWVGTSTAPLIGVLAAVAICAAGLYTYRNKKGNTND